jgi:hypothetical protein
VPNRDIATTKAAVLVVIIVLFTHRLSLIKDSQHYSPKEDRNRTLEFRPLLYIILNDLEWYSISKHARLLNYLYIKRDTVIRRNCVAEGQPSLFSGLTTRLLGFLRRTVPCIMHHGSSSIIHEKRLTFAHLAATTAVVDEFGGSDIEHNIAFKLLRRV